jgi:hypothetical protein
MDRRALRGSENDLATAKREGARIKRSLLWKLRLLFMRPNIDHKLDIETTHHSNQALKAWSVLTALHASNIGLMNAQPLGKLALSVACAANSTPAIA